jgi:predicted thioesterase
MKIPLGLKIETSNRVLREDTAIFHGSGSLNVLSTPSLVKYMEQAAFQLLEPSLENTETTVGISMHIEHNYPALEGEIFTCFATLNETNSKKYIFILEAKNIEGITLGTATHTRYIINRKKFLAKFKK